MQISNLNPNQTISTIVLLQMVNEARLNFSEEVIRSDNFLNKVKGELEDELGFPEKKENPQGGRPALYYTLTVEQAMLVAMRSPKL